MIGYLLNIGGILVMGIGVLLVFASMKPDVFRVRRSTTIAAGTSQALRNLLMNLMGMKATK